MSALDLMDELTRGDLLAAIRAVEAGYPNSFAESTKFDLVFEGKRHPPKRIVGVAVQLRYGAAVGPKSFKGGAESKCFRVLNRCGFTVASKPDGEAPSAAAAIAEVLRLQQAYSKDNTPEMQQRGKLVRDSIPMALSGVIEKVEPTFSAAGYACRIEGSDGTGLKNESPWVRLFDPEESPSATRGWYIVLHFSRKGDVFFATVGCGATTYSAGSFVDVPDTELAKRVAWARDLVASDPTAPVGFDDEIELFGNRMSRQFEKATAFARRYALGTLDDSQLIADLAQLAEILMRIYDAGRAGVDPGAPSVEERILNEAAQLTRSRSKGQGRGLTKAEQTAVELRAMDVARALLQAQGFEDIKDTSDDWPFDYEARYQGEPWIAEVKGTTSRAGDIVLMTANEVETHRLRKGKTALVVVHSIALDRSSTPPVATGGIADLYVPWDVDAWAPEPTAYRLKKKTAS